MIARILLLVLLLGCVACAHTRLPEISEIRANDLVRLSALVDEEPDAAFLLGLYYTLTVKDKAQGQRWLKHAADFGHVEAQLNLSFALRRSGDEQKAVRYLSMAVGSGNTTAMTRLAQLLVERKQGPADWVSTRHLYTMLICTEI